MKKKIVTTEAITLKMLGKFVEIRNKTNYSSNLQFMIDAQRAGFELEALPQPEKFQYDGFSGFRWRLPHLECSLIEFGGRVMWIEDVTILCKAGIFEQGREEPKAKVA